MSNSEQKKTASPFLSTPTWPWTEIGRRTFHCYFHCLKTIKVEYSLVLLSVSVIFATNNGVLWRF